jgi:hypothetical protein
VALDAESIRRSILARLEIVDKANNDPELQAIIMARAAKDAVWWFNTFCWTYNPKNIAFNLPAYLPFDLFPRQVELVHWLDERVAAAKEAGVEKSRDIGWTWVAGGYSVHRWLFCPGFKTTFGSRVEDLVDEKGNPDSIFGKIRLLIDRLPRWMLPPGFRASDHDNFMRLINPANGNIVSGEAGDQMGRGGRSSLYVVDEAAFIERPERVDAALTGNADTRIWASSANGMGNLFFRKIHGGNIPVFRFHWRDDPRKDEKWAEEKKKETDPVVWASEYEIDYGASMEGICIPGEWVQSSRRLAVAMNRKPQGRGIAGLDVGAGRAYSVLISKFGPVVTMPKAWQTADNIQTTYEALAVAQQTNVDLINYDSVGVGNTVTSVLMHANTGDLRVVPVNTGIPATSAVMQDERLASDWFGNLKAQIWWAMRDAFKATHEHVLYLEGHEDGVPHPDGDLILLPDDGKLVSQIPMVRWFRNDKGKIIIESKKQLAQRGVPSPDYADSLVLCFAPPDSEICFATL